MGGGDSLAQNDGPVTRHEHPIYIKADKDLQNALKAASLKRGGQKQSEIAREAVVMHPMIIDALGQDAIISGTVSRLNHVKRLLGSKDVNPPAKPRRFDQSIYLGIDKNQKDAIKRVSLNLGGQKQSEIVRTALMMHPLVFDELECLDEDEQTTLREHVSQSLALLV